MTLNVTAVENYTKGRLAASDAETQRQLDAALATARRYCGWHVTPVRTDELVLDGPGGPTLMLPTQKLLSITSLVEDGITLNLSAITYSRRGFLTKKYSAMVPLTPQMLQQYDQFTRRPINFWTDQLSGITVTISHGYTAAEAADFEGAVLSITDRMASTSEGGTVTSVGPFRWANDNNVTAGTAFTTSELAILDKYRLEQSA